MNAYKFCLIGNPVEHSRSPWIHKQFSKQFGFEIEYIKITSENFQETLREFRKAGSHGCNITMPFKQDAYQLTDELSERAKIAKAVNTLLFRGDATLYGDNTDGVGLINDITKNLNYSLKGKSILILGAGGAARGVLHALLMGQPTNISIVNRTLEKAQQLATEFRQYGNVLARSFSDLPDTRYDVVIDSTGFLSELPLHSISIESENSLCYDLKYSDTPTPFLQWAKNKSATILSDGSGMLIEQAAESFFVWTNHRPDTKALHIPSNHRA